MRFTFELWLVCLGFARFYAWLLIGIEQELKKLNANPEKSKEEK